MSAKLGKLKLNVNKKRKFTDVIICLIIGILGSFYLVWQLAAKLIGSFDVVTFITFMICLSYSLLFVGVAISFKTYTKIFR